MERELYAGLDLGGTKIAAAVLTRAGRTVGEARLNSRAGTSGDTVAANMVRAVHAALKGAGASPKALRGAGIGAPGPLDWKAGVIHFAPNLGMRNYPLRVYIQERLGVPVFLDNDVNMGTYGEYLAGAARGYHHVLGVFCGTGIGGGLVVDGQVFRGANGTAGEIGHTIVHSGGALCSCGQRGCLEAYASRSAMARDLVMLANVGQAPTVRAAAGTKLKAVKSGVIARAVAAGEPAVCAVVDQAAHYLGIGIANCVNLFSPDVVVLGGGLAEKLGGRYVKQVDRSLHRHALEAPARDVRVVPAQLGDDAAIHGAVGALREMLGETA
jgi:glucokinase